MMNITTTHKQIKYQMTNKDRRREPIMFSLIRSTTAQMVPGERKEAKRE
jgi:hypothetical protein